MEDATIFPRFIKRLDEKFYTPGIVLLIISGILLRLILITNGWPITNSDEAIMDLMAKHINDLGEHPTFFYGQLYMGSIEAYVRAVFFRLFGTSLLSMHLTTLMYFTGFLICIYYIGRRLYCKGVVLISLIFLVGGSLIGLRLQLQTVGGYPELLLIAPLFFLISLHLANTYGQTRWRSRALWYLLWGLLVGLALWTHQVVLPYVVASGLVLMICCWREFLKWGLWIVLVGLVIGAWPLINYNLHAAPGQDTITTMITMSQQGKTNIHNTLSTRLRGTFLVTLPRELGFESSCFITDPSFQTRPLHSAPCFLVQATMGLGFTCLLLIAAIASMVVLVNIWRHRYQDHDTVIRQQTMSRQAGRFGLALAALLTIFIYANSPGSTFAPIELARYICLILISVPAAFSILWDGIGMLRKVIPSARAKRLFPALYIGFILLCCIFTSRSIIWLVTAIPKASAKYQEYVQLAGHLEEIGVTRFYSQYWTCNVLIFISQERLICGDTRGDLTHGYDRYGPYRHVMIETENPAFVYSTKEQEQMQTLETLLQQYQIHYKRSVFSHYIIYQPDSPIPGLLK